MSSYDIYSEQPYLELTRSLTFLEVRSPQQVTHLAAVRDLLLPLAWTPDTRVERTNGF